MINVGPLLKARAKTAAVQDDADSGYAGSDAPLTFGADEASRVSWDFAKIPLRASVQAKLLVGSSDDPLEDEAERFADEAIGMPAPAAGAEGLAPRIDRRVDSGLPLQPVLAADKTLPRVQQVLNTPGAPLDAATRAFMERRFERSFESVRIHADESAAQSARDIEAAAYTFGSHVVFGAGRYAPATANGQRLLAHELTHVVQQSAGGRPAAGRGPILRRQPEPAAKGAPAVRDDTSFYAVDQRLFADKLMAELLRLALIPRSATGYTLYGNGVGFTDAQGRTVALALDVTRIVDGREVFAGYEITDLTLAGRSSAASPKPGAGASRPASPPRPKMHTNGSAQAAKPPAGADVRPPTVAPKTPDEVMAELAAVPEPVKDVLRGAGEINPQNQAQYLRIAKKLEQLQPEDLAMYKLIAKQLAADLDSFERSIDSFIQFKAQIMAQAGAESRIAGAAKQQTLEQKLASTWSGFDEQKFGTMTAEQKEATARDVAAKQRNIQLEHMVSHPGETALGMAEGMVRLDKVAKGIADDVKDAADGNKGAYTRIAGAVGGVNKFVAATASIVFVALLFVPGVNLVELATAGLAVAAASIVLSTAESELRIKAAGEAKTVEELKAETAKSAAAQTQAIVAAAMLALTLATKLIARIPLPGRYATVGAALKSAQAALLEKTGIGPAWQGVKADLVTRLSTAKQGLAEALAQQMEAFARVRKTVAGLSGPDFVKHLAAGDPELAELGISADQGVAIQQVSGTPQGQGVPERLRQDALKALDDAPAEAEKKVDEFIKNVDNSTAALDAAKTEQELKTALDHASEKLGPEEQAKAAVKDEQDFVKRRVTSARKSDVRARAKQQLADLEVEKTKTAAEIERLDEQLSDARIKVNRLKAKALALSRDSPERAAVMSELKAAQQEFDTLREEDALGGAREERTKQKEAEARILESLELQRPPLNAATKLKIEAAAKRTPEGFLDANTGEVIKGKPVYGHIYGKEHRRLVLEAAEKGMDQPQFNAWVNDHPEWFQLETEANNASHKYEKPGVD